MAEETSTQASPQALKEPAPGGRAAAPQTGTPEPAGEEEIGGPEGPDPTRFGDWERKGRCIDF
jgi:hypothetical protein